MEKVIYNILDSLNKKGFLAYIVGGYVRDYLLGINSFDVDICTNALPNDLEGLFKVKANSFGVITLKISDYNIDITPFRKEDYYIKRKPTKIEFINSLEEDLKRRDFTINAICMDKNEMLIDKLDGLKDLHNKEIRIIGDTAKKLKDDPLRILRAVRFATILEFNISFDLKKYNYLVKNLSGFRIKEELIKILDNKNRLRGLNLIKEYNLDLGLIFHINSLSDELYINLAQIEYRRDIPFTKSEKNTILDIRKSLKIYYQDFIERK